jgi:cell division protein FtsN
MKEVLETVSEVQFRSIAVIVAVALLGMVATWYILTGSASPSLTHSETDQLAEPLPKAKRATAHSPEPAQASEKPEIGVEEGEAGLLTTSELSFPQEKIQGEFAVQIGVFKQQEGAKRRKEELEEQGYTARIIPCEIDGVAAFRVVVGGFGSREEAVETANSLKQAGIDAFVRNE